MISWSDFKAQQPDLARQGADLLYHFGVGLAFLATVRADGGPRLHPMCPLLAETGLYAFIVPSAHPSLLNFMIADSCGDREACDRQQEREGRVQRPDQRLPLGAG